MTHAPCCCYLLHSSAVARRQVYIGFTRDLPRRLLEHLRGRGSTSTQRAPHSWRLVATVHGFGGAMEAMQVHCTQHTHTQRTRPRRGTVNVRQHAELKRVGCCTHASVLCCLCLCCASVCCSAVSFLLLPPRPAPPPLCVYMCAPVCCVQFERQWQEQLLWLPVAVPAGCPVTRKLAVARDLLDQWGRRRADGLQPYIVVSRYGSRQRTIEALAHRSRAFRTRPEHTEIKQ